MPVADAALPETMDWDRHALFLDFDGTLTPIVARPDMVSLSPETRELIAGLIAATSGAVALISGRGLADLASYTGDLPVTLSGSHGLELQFPGGAVQGQPGFDPVLDQARAALTPLAEAEGLLLERKPGAVALHYRAHPDCAETARAAVEETAATLELRHMHGNLVSEAAPRGIDKGTALTQICDHPPFRDRLPIMIGDDTTDEDGFAGAQALGGFGLRIGEEATQAKFQLPDMEAAHAWLRRVSPRKAG